MTASDVKFARPNASGRAIIRSSELHRMVPFSRVHIWRLEQANSFPARLQLGPNSVWWYLDEVQGWIDSRIRGGGRGPGRPAKAA
jgi:prophage regulatory protein